ncbi:MAG: hypothetical protein ACYSWU_02180 [Planctomycetota bacterium]|jgi:hypothetical protein
MSESSLALTYDNLMAATAERAGYGYRANVAAGLSANEETEVDLYVKEGYREFLLAYEWSFTRPVTTSVLWATETGTVTGQGVYSSPSTTITASGTFFPTMVGHSFVFGTSGTSYTIDGYTSATVITVTGNASAETADDSFTITANGSYRLPDDFGGLIGDVFFEANDGRYIPLDNTGEAELIAMQQASTSTGRPTICATSTVAATGTVGTRWNLLAWRYVDSDYTVRYQYQVLPDALATTNYPYGGARHADTIKYACYAAMERSKFQLANGPNEKQYAKLLRMSIKADQRGTRPGTLGIFPHARSGRRGRWGGRGLYYPLAGTVTSGGTYYP